MALVLITNEGLTQSKRVIEIGILLDEKSPELDPLVSILQQEIRSVIGEDAEVSFAPERVLANDHNIDVAERNYQTLMNGPAEIIIAFGPINNVVISKVQEHRKPTVLFGTAPKEFATLDNTKTSSGINNLAYLITSLSFTDDLQAFADIYPYKNVGVAVNKDLSETLPVTEVLDEIFEGAERSYVLIPFDNISEIIEQLDDIDALYLGGGFLLSDEQVKELADALIDEHIPSFTSTSVRDVELGLMATNQTNTNVSQIIRRIALSVEAIVNGTNPADLPLYIENANQLTINFNTADILNVPIRYSLIATTNFVGNFENINADKKYNLLDVINDAIANNLALGASAKDVELVGQDLKTAKSNYLPDITASATGTYLDPEVARISNGQNPELSTDGNITLTQTIFSPAVSAGINIQRDLQEAQQENYNADKLDLVFEASNAYFNALLLKANLQISSSNLDVTKRNLEIALQNYESGEAGKADVLRFRSQMAQNTQQLVEAVNSLEQAYFALNQLLNEPIEREIDVEDVDMGEGIYREYKYEQLRDIVDNPELLVPFISFLVDEAMKNAPELKSLEHNLNVTRHNLKLAATGRYMPTVALQGQYNRNFSRSGEGTDVPMGFPAVPQSNYNVGLNLSLPIFQQNKQNINRQTALIQQQQIRLTQDNVELQIKQGVQASLLNLINQISNIELAKVSESTAQESLELTQEAYASGASNRVQLIDAQNNYFQAQLANANAAYNFLLSAIQLERQIGYFFLLHTNEENNEFRQRFFTYLSSRN